MHTELTYLSAIGALGVKYIRPFDCLTLTCKRGEVDQRVKVVTQLLWPLFSLLQKLTQPPQSTTSSAF
jgi:hypothetical protein